MICKLSSGEWVDMSKVMYFVPDDFDDDGSVRYDINFYFDGKEEYELSIHELVNKRGEIMFVNYLVPLWGGVIDFSTRIA